jgi:type I restriction enzyme S subunit
VTAVAALGDLIEKVSQVSPERLGREVFAYVDISAIDRTTKRIVDVQKIEVTDAPSRARQLIRVGDVLVSTVRPNLNAVAQVTEKYDGEIASTGFCVVRPKCELLDSSYLFHLVQSESFISHLVSRSTGAGYPAVTDEDVKDALIPLPPLAEQKRIAAVLSKADRVRRLRRCALEVGAGYLQSVFLEMFKARLSTSAKSTPLGELVTITGGGTPSRDVAEYFMGTIPWLTSKDMIDTHISDTQEHITEQAIANSATKLIPAGSILVVAKSKVLMHRLPVAMATVPLCHGQDIKSIQCSEALDPLFLIQVLKFNEQRLLRQARGANTEGLTLPMLQEVPVPVVPLTEQLKYRAIATTFRSVRMRQTEAIRQADHLFAALLHNAFDRS